MKWIWLKSGVWCFDYLWYKTEHCDVTAEGELAAEIICGDDGTTSDWAFQRGDEAAELFEPQ